MNKLKQLAAMMVSATIAVTTSHAAETKAEAKPAPKAESPFKDDVVVKGKTIEIKRSQVEEVFTLFKSNAQAGGQAVPDDRQDFFKARILDRLISTKCLNNRATKEDTDKAKESATKYVGEAKKRMGNPEMFNAQLKAMGLTEQAFFDRIQEQAVCDEVINRELRSQITIPEAEIKAFYEKNAENFSEPEMVRAAHILIGTKDDKDTNPNPGAKKDLTEAQKAEKKKLAESVLARARKGEDFGKLAKEFSDDPGSKDKGGEYTFPRGQMVPEFEAAAFSLAVNQISDLVPTTFGYHIIKTLEKVPAKKSPLAEVTEQIKSQMQNEKIQERMPDYLQKVRKEAGIEILDPSLKVVEQTNTPPPPPPPAAPSKK